MHYPLFTPKYDGLLNIPALSANFKSLLVTTIAVNILMETPISRVNPKPFTPPVPIISNVAAAMIVVILESILNS